MAFARSVMPKPVRLGTFTQYWEPGAQPDKVRQLYQANVESQTPWIVPSSDEALASAASFKDFMGRGVPEFAATLAFVDVHLINVSGSKGNCFPHCSLHAMTCLDGAIPAHWGVGDGGSLEDQAARVRGWLRGKY